MQIVMLTIQHVVLQTFTHFYIITNYLNIQSSCRIPIIQTITQRWDFGTTQVIIQKYSFVIMTTEEHVCMLLRKQKNFKEIYWDKIIWYKKFKTRMQTWKNTCMWTWKNTWLRSWMKPVRKFVSNKPCRLIYKITIKHSVLFTCSFLDM